ncbi:hypothetical protein K439DRAFT_1191049 [Ramaria rubella]|nr:hypothetical protein K439DRAFT_1191049 [Ramaria rubella]
MATAARTTSRTSSRMVNKGQKKSTRKALPPVPRRGRSKMATIVTDNNPNSSESEDIGDGDMSDNEPLGLLLTIHKTDKVEPSPMIQMLRGGKEVVIKSNHLEAEDAVEYMDSSPLEKHDSALGGNGHSPPLKQKRYISSSSDDQDSDAESHNTKRPKAMGNDIVVKQPTNALGIPSVSTKLFIVPGARSSIGLARTSKDLSLPPAINGKSVPMNLKPRQSSLPPPATPAHAERQKSMPPATPPHPPPMIAKPRA